MAGSATPTSSAGHATRGAPADPELTLVPDHSSGADHRQVAPIAQLVPDGVEDCFAVLRETPEDQHRLGRDRVDHIPDLLVVEQKIDELRNLNIVDGDL